MNSRTLSIRLSGLAVCRGSVQTTIMIEIESRVFPPPQAYACGHRGTEVGNPWTSPLEKTSGVAFSGQMP